MNFLKSAFYDNNIKTNPWRRIFQFPMAAAYFPGEK